VLQAACDERDEGRRRVAETAARLVDAVPPAVPLRRWMLAPLELVTNSQTHALSPPTPIDRNSSRFRVSRHRLVNHVNIAVRRPGMAENALLGSKIRALRRRETLTQAALADRLEISPSYLNLIESNRRPLTAPLLLRLAQQFKLDLTEFAGQDDARLMADLMEVFGDPVFEEAALADQDVRVLAVSNPVAARAVLQLYRTFKATQESAQTLASRVSDGAELSSIETARLPSEEVGDFLQRRMNHFPELEAAAEELWRDANLNIDELYRALVRFLKDRHGIGVRVVRPSTDPGAVRRFDPVRREITVSELLAPRSRHFQVAHQVGLLTQGALFDRIVRDDAQLSSDESRALARVALASYFASAVLMPYAPFLEAARAERYDLELLGHRFRTSFEQVAHRLTTLRRRGAEGVPFHFLRIDVAGNISKRFSASGIRFARFSGACPRWNVHSAFQTPGLIRVQLSRMNDGAQYFCIARTVTRSTGGYHSIPIVQAIGLGCRVEHAKGLVYADGMDLSHADAAVPVGVTCRLCDRMQCEQRVHPPLHHPLRIDENVRGLSFYAPAGDGPNGTTTG